MLQYNTLVYLPLEDLSFFKVMVFRPDKSAYLVENCDPDLAFSKFYRNISLDEIPEKMITTKEGMEKFWEEESKRLKEELKSLKTKQYSPEYALTAKLQDLENEIQKNRSKITPDLDSDKKTRIEKVIKQLEKGARRTQGKQGVKYKKFQEEIDKQIRRAKTKLEKYEKDKKKLSSLI